MFINTIAFTDKHVVTRGIKTVHGADAFRGLATNRLVLTISVDSKADFDKAMRALDVIKYTLRK